MGNALKYLAGRCKTIGKMFVFFYCIASTNVLTFDGSNKPTALRIHTVRPEYISSGVGVAPENCAYSHNLNAEWRYALVPFVLWQAQVSIRYWRWGSIETIAIAAAICMRIRVSITNRNTLLPTSMKCEKTKEAKNIDGGKRWIRLLCIFVFTIFDRNE